MHERPYLLPPDSTCYVPTKLLLPPTDREKEKCNISAYRLNCSLPKGEKALIVGHFGLISIHVLLLAIDGVHIGLGANG